MVMMDKDKDFEIPHAAVVRILKSALPPGVQLSKEARTAFSKSAGIFVLYLTAVANDFCRENKRQTLSVQDVFEALKEIDMEEFVEPLETCLAAQRADMQARKKAKTDKEKGPSKPDDDESEHHDKEKSGKEKDSKGEKANGKIASK